ncbi:MAG: branched-chain amino acid transport system substrate-binding protein [Actinomycetota bacterium]|nr:branched-chain amino acid transport system substrate-binding protein [Actinomycetota bacterium]
MPMIVERRLAAVLVSLAMVAGACSSGNNNPKVSVGPSPQATQGTAAPGTPDGAAPATPGPDAAPQAALAAPGGASAASAPGSQSAPSAGAKSAASNPSPGAPAPRAAAAGPAPAAPAGSPGGGPGAPVPSPTPGKPGPAPAPGAANFASDTGVTDASIKLGTIGILSGPVSGIGADLSYAGQAVVRAANDAGGVNGRKLDLLVRDDAWDGTKGMNAARDLVEREKIFAFSAVMTTATTDLLAPYADQIGIPNVGSDGFGDAQYGRQWSWPAGNSSVVDGYALAEYAVKEQNVKTVGILYFDAPFARAYRDSYKRYIESLGAKVVVEQAGSFDDPGTAAFIAKCRAANVDLITFNGEPGLWVKMVREAQAQGYKPPKGFQGPASLPFNAIPGLAGPWAEGSVSTQNYTPNDIGEARGDQDPGYAKYSAVVTKYYPNIQHSSFTKGAYMGGSLLIDAMKRLGANVTRKGVKDILDGTKSYDLGLGARLNYQCDHRGNHTTYFVKIAKDPDAAKSSDKRARDAVDKGEGSRWKFVSGPVEDKWSKPC